MRWGDESEDCNTGWSVETGPEEGWGAGTESAQVTGEPVDLALTFILIEALDEGGGQALVADLTRIGVMALVLWTGQCQGAAEAVGAFLAVLVCETVLEVAVLGNPIHFPLDTDIFGVEIIHQAHDRDSSGPQLFVRWFEEEDGWLSIRPWGRKNREGCLSNSEVLYWGALSGGDLGNARDRCAESRMLFM